MQSESIQIHNLRKNIISLVKTIMEFYIKSSYLANTEIEYVNYKNPDNFVPIENLYMGAKVTAAISQSQHPESDVKAFKLKILDFYVEGVTQIYKRFPFANPVLKQIDLIDPIVVQQKKYNSLAGVATHFPNITGEENWQQLDNEWRLLMNADIDFTQNVTKFWQNESKEKIGDEYAFPTLSKFINGLMALPHSSAAVERVFSAINLNKTKQRNALKSSTLCGIMHSKRLFHNKSCFSIVINRDILSKFNASMYDDNEEE